jgi:Cu+-exporting ATPase
LSDKVSQYFTIIIVAIAAIGLAFWMFKGEVEQAIFVFTAVLIVACPCALALSIPFTFGSTMRIFGKKGMYIKNTSVIERLSRIDTVVFDKTGTLTQPNESQITYTGGRLSEADKQAIYSLVKQSTHPLSHSIASSFRSDFSGRQEAGEDKAITYQSPEHFVEVSGRGIYGKVGSREIKMGSAEYVNAPGSTASATRDPEAGTLHPEKEQASEVHLAINDKIIGVYTIHNQYREGFEEVMDQLGQGFDMYLLSGDNASEHKHLSAFFKPEHLLFNQKPGDKAQFIKDLQDQGHTVLMTGDGLNDAGALLQSDVALSLANKVYHFSPASDAVLEAGKFQRLASFIRFTRTSLRIVIFSFLISFLYNVVGISFAITGNLSPIVAAILMPVSSVSVVAFATFSTRAMAKF